MSKGIRTKNANKILIKIDGVEPKGAVRMTGRGKFVKPAAQRYLSYKDILGMQMRKQMQGEPLTGILDVTIFFMMPIPKSYSKKKQEALIGDFHFKKPDIDNLIKGAFDAANKILWKDDGQVYRVTAAKYYSEEPGIIMTVKEV